MKVNSRLNRKLIFKKTQIGTLIIFVKKTIKLLFVSGSKEPNLWYIRNCRNFNIKQKYFYFMVESYIL